MTVQEIDYLRRCTEALESLQRMTHHLVGALDDLAGEVRELKEEFDEEI